MKQLVRSYKKDYSLNFDAVKDAICLSLYILGTMGVPMRVHFIHRKVLSQKAGISPALASLFR
jgi:hypothetical protein